MNSKIKQRNFKNSAPKELKVIVYKIKFSKNIIIPNYFEPFTKKI
jgi:hypothetical protein